jgi:hypothetical protein
MKIIPEKLKKSYRVCLQMHIVHIGPYKTYNFCLNMGCTQHMHHQNTELSTINNKKMVIAKHLISRQENMVNTT